ncbi:glycosyltransferase family 2 protein [Viscerimonas tarda]
MSIRLSIIIPVYNVEKYLERCILSVVNQGVSDERYELIVVNDGSTDSSREILVRLKSEYPVIRIIDKENGGLSSARNAAIQQATGEYLFFLDSDDWISAGSLSFLLNWVEEYPVDILLFGACEIYDSGKQVSLATNFSPNNKVMSVEDYLLNYTLRSSAWISLFSKRLLDENRITMKEGFLAEDDDFVVRIFSVAKEIVCNDRLIYYYYQRSDSISNGKEFDEKVIADKLIILKDNTGYVKQFSGKLRQGLDRKLDFLAVDILRLLIRKNQPSQRIDAVLQELKQMGYYPLKKAPYSTKYKLFRALLYYPVFVKLARYFKQGIAW